MKSKKLTYKEYIGKLASRIRRTIFHGEYEMTIGYAKTPKNSDDSTVAAEITVDSVYLNFVLTVYPHCKELHRKKQYSKLCDILVHEFCHLLTEPLYREVRADAAPSQTWIYKDINERQVQRITNCITWQLKEDFYSPKSLTNEE